MNKHGAIGILSVEDGDVSICANTDPSGAGYGTLCGVSLDDDLHQIVEIPYNARISCVQCRAVWESAQGFRSKNFTTPKNV